MISRQNALEVVSFLGPEQNFAAAIAAAAETKTARRRIWDLSGHYHCSIIGTCLSASELRKLLVKLDMAAPGDNDHDLHGRGVGLAGRQDMAGKLLNKALDERHQVTIKRYGRAKTEAELRAFWQQDVRAGDIPGGYWAVMTHPLAGHDLVREVFGHVHMLSHLVGAALQAELEAVERSLRTGTESQAGAAPITLDGLTVLYLGGRPAQMPHIRQAAAERGGKLLHHDGGIEDNDLVLAGMVSRADIIFFPVDCVSHGAVGTVKRTCRSEGKRYVPLRSAAVTSFIAGLCA
jgi:hypothetical protein